MQEFLPGEMSLGPRSMERFEDEEYDVYLFWPSERTLDAAFMLGEKAFTNAPVQSRNNATESVVGTDLGPVLPISSGSPSTSNFDSSVVPITGDQDVPLDELPAAPPVAAEYSKLVKMGLVFSQVTHRAFDAVRVMWKKTS